MKNIQLNHSLEMSDLLEKSYVIDVTIDINNNIWLLTQLKVKPDKDLQYKFENASSNYEIYHLMDGSLDSKIRLNNSDVNFHFLRVLENDEYLIVGARCTYHSETNIEKNAVIVDGNGNKKRRFVLGDGIQDIKIENNSTIWTSYFDEGIYGNYGWDNPIGSCGLRSWSLSGEVDYVYNPKNYDYAIDDCYSLNISSNNDKWFYFYMEFYLGRITDDNVEYYTIDTDGASTMAVSDKFIVSDEGYGKRNTFSLLVENNKKFKKLKTFDFADMATNESIDIVASYAYSEYILMRTSNKIYMTSISDIKSKLDIL